MSSTIVKPLSPRNLLANRIAEVINKNNLNRPYGGDVQLSGDKSKCYAILFSYPRTVDGLVRVYSEKYIVVSWQTMYHHIPHNDTFKFTNEKDAVDFIIAAFVSPFNEAECERLLTP